MAVGTKVRLASGDFGRMAEAVAKSLEGSLARLRLDRIDIFHLHNAITETGGGESLSVRQVRVALASFALAGFTALSLASTAQLGDCHRLVELGDRAEHLADQLGRGRLTDVLGGQVQVYFASTWQMIDFPLAPAAPIVAKCPFVFPLRGSCSQQLRRPRQPSHLDRRQLVDPTSS